MGILEPIKNWLLTVALKKAIKRAAVVFIAFLTSAKVAPILSQWGISIDAASMEVALTVFLTGAIELLRNFLKNKLGAKFL